jgi:hypothetical protein
VDVTSDLTALCQQRLLAQLTPRPLELDHESLLASDRATDDPHKDDGHDPEGDGDFHWILDEGHEHGRSRGEHTERHCSRERRRPTRGCESKQRDVEHDRLELSGMLGHDHRDNDRDSDGGERHAAGESPQAPGGDGHRREGNVSWRGRLGDHRDERKRQREERQNSAKVVCFEPTSNGPSSHTPTVLRGSRCGVLLQAEPRTPTGDGSVRARRPALRRGQVAPLKDRDGGERDGGCEREHDGGRTGLERLAGNEADVVER